MINVTEYEQTVLGSFFEDPGLLKETKLHAHHFHTHAHRTIMETLLDMDREGIVLDMVTFTNHAGSKIAGMGGASYLIQLVNSVPSVANFKAYEDIVLDKWRERQTKAVGQSMLQESMEIQDVIERLIQVANEGTNDEDDGDITGAIQEILDEAEEDTGDVAGVATGYKEIDDMLGGLKKTELIIIAARPSMGKTAFALNVAEKSVRDSEDVTAIFSLEMDKKELVRRLLSIVGNIQGVRMRNPKAKFVSDDWVRLLNAAGILGDSNLKIFDDKTITISKIWAKVARLKRNYPDKNILVMLDYLQLINADQRMQNRQQEISEISRQLKLMAGKLDVSVVALSQLSREVEKRQDKRPIMSDLRESGAIEQDADVVGFLYREDYYNPETERQNITEFIVAKQRNGPIGTVDLFFMKDTGSFHSFK